MITLIKRFGALVLLAGALGVASATTVHVRLSGAAEVPAVKSAASATAVISVLPDHAVRGELTTHGIRPTMVHIHEGAAGTNGPIVIWLKHTSANVWRVPAGAKLTPAQYRAFRAGDLYLNVHSHRHPAGELRGQIKP